MARNFNISDRDWDLLYSFHSFYNNSLIKIADSFELKLSSPIHQVYTCYVNNHNNSNSVTKLG